MGFLNMISLVGIFGLCAIAWLLSENRQPKYFPWRVVVAGLLFQFFFAALVFLSSGMRQVLSAIAGLLNVVFAAADAGARLVFGRTLVPPPGQESFFLIPLIPGTENCVADSVGQIVPGFCGVRFGYIFAFRALPAIVFLAGLIALLYRFGVIQWLVRVFSRLFYNVFGLSGAESLSGIANILVGIEALIVVKPYLAKMTRSELCATLACCFGTASSATLPSYISILRPVFPDVVTHLIAASIMAIPACFLLSKILVPELEMPLTRWDTPYDKDWHTGLSERAFSEQVLSDRFLSDQSLAKRESVDEPNPLQEVSPRLTPMEAAISGALVGVKVAISIVGVLILVLGLVYLLYEFIAWLATLPDPVGGWFKVITLPNILGILSLPFTVLTGVSLNWTELWQSSLLIGRRLFETAILPYQSLVAGSSGIGTRILGDRAILLLTYALAGFAHLAYWGIVVGGAIALAPSRSRDIIQLSWKALLAGILATYMIACFIGFFDGLFGMSTGEILGR